MAPMGMRSSEAITTARDLFSIGRSPLANNPPSSGLSYRSARWFNGVMQQQFARRTGCELQMVEQVEAIIPGRARRCRMAITWLRRPLRAGPGIIEIYQSPDL